MSQKGAEVTESLKQEIGFAELDRKVRRSERKSSLESQIEKHKVENAK